MCYQLGTISAVISRHKGICITAIGSRVFEHTSHQHSLSYVCGPSPRSIRGTKTGHKKPASKRKTSQAIGTMSLMCGRDREHADS